MLLSQNSQLILRNNHLFKTKKIFFHGNIQDNIAFYLPALTVTVNIKKCSNNIQFNKNKKNIKIYNNFIISSNMVKNCNTIIYYWPKDKEEAKFQLINLMSCSKKNTQIFIVGENYSGIKSSIFMLGEWISLKKIDSARHSILLVGVLKKKSIFFLKITLKYINGKNII